MKCFHISDLHLGKRLLDVSILEEQRYILDQIVERAGEERPNAVLICAPCSKARNGRSRRRGPGIRRRRRSSRGSTGSARRSPH